MLIGSHGMLTFFFFFHTKFIYYRWGSSIILSLCRFVAGMQFLYTTAFGVFASFIFMRTGERWSERQHNDLTYSTQPVKYVPSLSAGHVVGPVLSHSFCNSQGLPDISSALQHPQRSALLFSYVMGLLLFLVLLFPLTDPFFYGAIPVCSLAPPPESVCQIKWN